MLPTRALLTRRPGLRVFHSITPYLQQATPTVSQNEDSMTMEDLAKEVGSVPSTNRASVTRAETIAPYEIFEAWKVNSFYAPLAFLRSRRIRPTPKRKVPPATGPGAAEAVQKDVFRQLDIDPVFESNNSILLSAFVTTMGRIRPRSHTRLSWRSQRKVTQAVKRSKQKGVLPIAYTPRLHPTKTYSNRYS